VIVGKRALPALALTVEGGDPAAQLALLAEPEDVVMAFGPADLRGARSRGCLTVAFGPTGAEYELEPAGADPCVRQEVAETAYHLLWELVHVFFEHRGLLEGRALTRTHDSGASSFLYPFLGETETDLDAVLSDVRRSIALKAGEIAALRTQTLQEGGELLAAAAAALRARLDGGGRLLVLGNGGSATDAMDAAADLRFPPGPWPARPAIDLTEDAAILTAVANDVGVEAVFSRQVIAHGRPGDALLTFSTSGGSANVIHALAEARRQRLLSIAMVGYDGGRILADRLADHVVVTRSEHIPRIQEAQASAWHVLRELLEVCS
jgi:D-sedoheptulose 7-phosphate isomerase